MPVEHPARRQSAQVGPPGRKSHGRIRVRIVAAGLLRRAVGNRIRESLFFIPAVLIVIGAGAAAGAAAIDRSLHASSVPRSLRIPADSAHVLLATIAGATITTVGVIFSITVVSVQLASGQFSPRVVRGFFRDRYAQTVIGVLASTFAFCVLSLYAVVPASQAGGAPVVTTAAALLLAFASILTIVVYLDHSARALYVGTLADHVMDESIALVRTLPAGATAAEADGDEPDGDGHVVISHGASGWVQQISIAGLLAAVPEASTVRVETRAGAYVTTGTPIAVVWPAPGNPDNVDENVNRSIVLGAERTMQQDLDFGLRQLTDIALRALSPAVNDPTTAIEVIVRLGSILHELLGKELDRAPVTGLDGRRVLRPLSLDHGDYIRHGFLQLRRVVPEHPVVAVAYIRTLRMLSLTATRCGRHAAATTAHDMISACLEMARRADLLADEQRMLTQAAGASSPSDERR